MTGGSEKKKERKWPNMLVKTLSYSSCVVETRSREREIVGHRD
jgi:hypothetical protein